MRILLLNQSFPPDAVSTAQHAGALGKALSSLGHEFTVVTSQRAYDNRSIRFAAREEWYRVRVLRIRCSGFGKSSKWRRALDFATFLGNCCLRLTTLPRFDL